VSWSNPDTVKLGSFVFPYAFSVDDGDWVYTKLYVPSATLAAYEASKQWQWYFSTGGIIGE
jgi:hypothetical protein